jgi:hypothetical protein
MAWKQMDIRQQREEFAMRVGRGEALARIAALYAIEEQIRGKPAEVRRAVRHEQARPLLDELRHWMEKTLASLSTKSETAGAIRYALSRWRALTRYVDDGLLEIDNNAAERALRSVATRRSLCPSF